MSSLDTLSIEKTVLLTGTFITALLALALLTQHRWWHTVHGRSLGFLSLGVVGVLLPTVLMYWHVIAPDKDAGIGTWITTQCFLLLPVAFLVMCWQMVRPWVRPWLVRHHLAKSYEPAKRERQSIR